MDILNIKVTQKKLRRLEILNALIESIKNNNYIEPITLIKTTEGELVCQEGHHRLAAYRLQGREELEDYEYEILYTDTNKPRFGNVGDLISRSGQFNI